jgi:ABC-type uncharacterized transport system permease subunit
MIPRSTIAERKPMILNGMALVATALYLTTSALLGMRLSRGAAGQSGPKIWFLAFGLAAVVFHGAVLHAGVFTRTGLDLSFFNALSLIAWVIALTLLLAAVRKPVEMLGIVLLPLAALALVLTMLDTTSTRIVPSRGWALDVHILISIFSYGVLTIAAVQAILLAVQDKHLREKHPGGFVRALPPLQTMETLLFQMIWLGFALLTLALFSGFLFLEDMFAQHLVQKTVLSIAAWTVFGLLLWGRRRFGWRGRTAIRWTLSGIFVLMLAYFGSKLVVELILARTT